MSGAGGGCVLCAGPASVVLVGRRAWPLCAGHTVRCGPDCVLSFTVVRAPAADLVFDERGPLLELSASSPEARDLLAVQQVPSS